MGRGGLLRNLGRLGTGEVAFAGKLDPAGGIRGHSRPAFLVPERATVVDLGPLLVPFTLNPTYPSTMRLASVAATLSLVAGATACDDEVKGWVGWENTKHAFIL